MFGMVILWVQLSHTVPVPAKTVPMVGTGTHFSWYITKPGVYLLPVVISSHFYSNIHI